MRILAVLAPAFVSIPCCLSSCHLALPRLTDTVTQVWEQQGHAERQHPRALGSQTSMWAQHPWRSRTVSQPRCSHWYDSLCQSARRSHRKAASIKMGFLLLLSGSALKTEAHSISWRGDCLPLQKTPKMRCS